jgi:hypothetical protein
MVFLDRIYVNFVRFYPLKQVNLESKGESAVI